MREPGGAADAAYPPAAVAGAAATSGAAGVGETLGAGAFGKVSVEVTGGPSGCGGAAACWGGAPFGGGGASCCGAGAPLSCAGGGGGGDVHVEQRLGRHRHLVDTLDQARDAAKLAPLAAEIGGTVFAVNASDADQVVAAETIEGLFAADSHERILRCKCAAG